MFLSETCLFCSQHAPGTENNEWYREYLSHVEWERGLECFLYLLGVFDEEAEGEDIRQAESEVPACADLLRHLLVECPQDEEE